jgi:hypothetical protein
MAAWPHLTVLNSSSASEVNGERQVLPNAAPEHSAP